jgi:hypothetical protein
MGKRSVKTFVRLNALFAVLAVSTMLGLPAKEATADMIAARAIKAEMGTPENRALSLVAAEHFNSSDVTVDPEIQAMKAANAQAAIVWTSGTSLGTALRGIANTGWNVPTTTTDSNVQYKQMEQYKKFIHSNFILRPHPPCFGIPPSEQYVRCSE